MRITRFRIIATICAALLLTLTACAANKPAPANNNTAPAQQAMETLLIGAALPMTGDLAPQGKEVKDGYEFWQDTVNAKGGLSIGGKKYKVEIKFYDYASDVNQAIKLVDKLITQDQVKFILGPYSSAHIIAVAPVAEKYGILHVNSTGASVDIYNKGYKYTFGLLPPSSEFARPWVEAVAAQNPKPKSIAILGRSDLFPLAAARAAEKLSKEAGIEVVYFGQYPPGTTDLTQALTEVKSKNPDVFWFTGYGNDAILAIRTAKQIGFKPKAFGATAGLTAPDFLNAMKENANEITTVESWIPNLPDSLKDPLFGTPDQYSKAFEAKYKYIPSYIPAASSVAGYIIGTCAQEVNSLDSAKVRDCVANWSKSTFYGNVKFNAGGQNQTLGYAVQIKYPKLEVIHPATFKTADFIFPMK